VIHPDAAFLNDINSFSQIIKEELNVRQVTTSNEQERFISLSATPNNRLLGKKWGPETSLINNLINNLTNQQIQQLQSEAALTINNKTILLSEVTVEWHFTGNADQESVKGEEVLVVLDVSESVELRSEGLIREIIREIQKMKKTAKLISTDQINIFYKLETDNQSQRKTESAQQSTQTSTTSADNGPIDLSAAIYSFQPLITSVVGSPLLPLTSCASLNPPIVTSLVDLHPAHASIVTLYLYRSSLIIDPVELLSLCLGNQQLMNSVVLLLGGKNLQHLKTTLNNNNQLMVKLDGEAITLINGKHFHLP